ncbi:pantothenate kinase 1 isoform X2 [Spinacia oleracea]|uniref:Pantothenate kinase 1 isoform X2 n=1 Tax=Spinacia oleracea TaxID=3562 RepID=A0A9R0JQ25_SPIOL|nr:pantothenate kinase 1 isoform X2 [Spinacia oleracea]
MSAWTLLNPSYSREAVNLGCRHQEVSGKKKLIIKATGGGAYKYADLFKEKFGVTFDKEDEMNSLVSGANFLLKAVPCEAFTYMEGRKDFVQINSSDLFPYLLVNIGSGISMIKVVGDGKFERVSGTSLGGGTLLGLGMLLTKCQSFDDLLEMSHKGDNRNIDMLVSDIYGSDYSKIGLSARTIASSFGKVIFDNKELKDYKKEDIARSLLRMISNNLAQIAYLIAMWHGKLKRIIFGGSFTRSHEYIMETISDGVEYWSKGETKAMFLRHEGFLGALGAFKSYEKHGLGSLMGHHLSEQSPVASPRPQLEQKSNGPLLVESTDAESVGCCILGSDTMKRT